MIKKYFLLFDNEIKKPEKYINSFGFDGGFNTLAIAKENAKSIISDSKKNPKFWGKISKYAIVKIQYEFKISQFKVTTVK